MRHRWWFVPFVFVAVVAWAQENLPEPAEPIPGTQGNQVAPDEPVPIETIVIGGEDAWTITPAFPKEVTFSAQPSGLAAVLNLTHGVAASPGNPGARLAVYLRVPDLDGRTLTIVPVTQRMENARGDEKTLSDKRTLVATCDDDALSCKLVWKLYLVPPARRTLPATVTVPLEWKVVLE